MSCVAKYFMVTGLEFAKYFLVMRSSLIFLLSYLLIRLLCILRADGTQPC